MHRSFLLLLAVTACDPTMVTIDGGPTGDGATGPAGTIEITSEPSLALTFGETAELTVRYSESGVPVEGVLIRFALEGTAHDTRVLYLTLMTDSDGGARTTLTAATVAAVFRVRVSADRAAPAYVNVSVSNVGFGALVVETIYRGARIEYTRRDVSVYSDIECDPPGGYPRTPARQSTLDDMALSEVAWRTLPAGLTYTVVSRLEGSTGVTLASACTDRIVIAADMETRVPLEYVDNPLVPTGRFDTEFAITADAFGDVSARGIAAGVAFASGGMGASVFLDSLEQALRDGGLDSEADALAMERAIGTAESDLDYALSAAGADPAEALREFFAALLGLLTEVRLAGPLRLVFNGATLEGSWTVETLEVGTPGAPDGPAPIPIDLTMSGLAPTPVLGLTFTGTEDVITVDALSLSLRMVELVGAAMDTALADATSSPGAALREVAGCSAFGTWVASSSVASVCDAACADTACVAALEGMLDAARTAVLAEPSLATMTVRGPLALHDDNGDLLADRLDGTLTGGWLGPMGRPSISTTGTLRGDRLRSPP